MPPEQPTTLVKLSNSEDTFLAELLKGRKRDVAVAIPSDMPPREVLVAIRSCAGMLSKLEQASGMLIPILGRLLAVVAGNPEILGAAGYDTLDSFEAAELLDKGVSRSSIWSAKQAYTVFPLLPIESYRKIPKENLRIAAKLCKNASESQKGKFLAMAAEKSPEQFKNWAEERSGLSEKGGETGATFTLNGSLAEVTEFKEWCANAGLVEWAGTDRPLGIVLAAIQSASSEFTSPVPLVVNGEIQSGQPEDDSAWT